MLKTFKIGALFDIHPTNANSATTTASASGVQKEFKNYRITDYFVVRNTHSIPKEYVRFGGSRPYVTAGSSDNAVAGYIDYDESLLEEGNSIMVGGKTTVVTYQPCDYFSNDSHNLAIIPKNSAGRTELAQLFIASALQKSLGAKYSWGDSVSYRKISKDVVSLPAGSDGEPDFAYMEERITELEEERITELDAYLIASGLEDYELTDEDKEILSPESASDEAGASWINGKNEEIAFSIFKIEEIFEVVEAGYKYKKKDFNKKRDVSPIPTEEYSLPLVNAKFGNNGIMYYGRKSDWNTQEMCIDIIQDGAVAAGTVYAQPESVGVLYNAYLIKPIEAIKSAEALLYMAECVEKSIKNKFSYDKKATWDRVKKCEISLPITSDGDINFDYMERYIRAIKKLAIADVAKYKNKLIATTRQVVGA